MRKECAGCGAILPDDVLACPICGGSDFKEASAVPPPSKTPRPQPTAPQKKETAEEPSIAARASEQRYKPVSIAETDPGKQTEMEQFFMDTITQLIVGGVTVDPRPALGHIPTPPSSIEQDLPDAKLIIHEVILFKADKTELVRKKYGTEVCSGIEIMRIRDFLASSEYIPNKFLFLDPEHRFATFGSSHLIFALKVSGSLHPQSEFVVKKVAEVGDTRLSSQSSEVSIEHLKHMMEKLCDALYSALVKLSG